MFVNDHLGFPGGVTHGSTTYLSSVLPRFDAARVLPHLAICREWHPAAERFDGTGVPLEFFERGKWDVRVLGDILRQAEAWRADILHLNGKKSHLLGRLAALRLGTPAIVHLHMVYDPKPRLLQPWLARRTSLAVGVSDALTRHAVEAFAIPPERAVTVYNGLDLERFRLTPEQEKAVAADVRRKVGVGPSTPLLTVVGRITRTPDKGQRYAIEALRQIRARIADATLLVVGDGPARAECEARAAEIGLADAVVFTGQRTDIERIWAAADIGIVPSVVDEALPYAAVEAQAVGRPVVAFGGGGTPEVVRDGVTGFIVPTGDVEGLAAAVVRILKDRELRARMATAAREDAIRFALPTHVRRLEELYRRILEETA